MASKVDYVFCLPGHPSSGLQTLYLQNAVNELLVAGKSYNVSKSFSCNIYSVRNGCLSQSGTRRDQLPFNGEYDYEKMIWVDSDILLPAGSIQKLLVHDVDIVAGWYRLFGMGQHNIDDSNVASCGFDDRKLLVGEIASHPVNDKGLIEVDYSGFGLMVVKRGVFESLGYPWFKPRLFEWQDENGIDHADIMGDDEEWCWNVKKLGFKIYVDPAVRVTHEKLVGL